MSRPKKFGKYATLFSQKDKVRAKIQTGLDNGVQKVLVNSENAVINEFTQFPKPPVQTGNLRRSIASEYLGNGAGQVTAGGRDIKGAIIRGGKRSPATVDVGYAKYVEFGNQYMPPRPYLRNGMKRAEPKNLAILRDELRKENDSLNDL